jgi:hypothetical protein
LKKLISNYFYENEKLNSEENNILKYTEETKVFNNWLKNTENNINKN